jgi:nucleolar protein 15
LPGVGDAQAEDSSDEKQPDFFSSSLSFEQPGGIGRRAGASAHARAGVPALPPGAGAEGAQDDGDSSTGGGGGGGGRAGAEGEAEAKGKRDSNIKLFDAPLARRRPREDNFDEELYLEVASRKKVMLPAAPQTLGARMDDAAAAGWRAPYESPRQRIAREKAERAARRAARGLKPTAVAHEGEEAGAAGLATAEKLAKKPRKEKAGKQGKKASRLSEGAEEAVAAGAEGVARGVRKREARDGKRDGIADKMFGMRAADFNDGEAFETRVGTSLVQDNLFYIPPHFEDEFVGSCNPDGALDKRKTQGQQQQSLRLAQGKALRERQKAKKMANELMIRGSAVLYVGHIPYGFYEEAQFQFFSQYGKVTRVRLSRDPKTNRYRGYGFVEFEDAAVAHEVCKEMNGYMLSGKRLRVHVVTPDKLHPQVFRNSHRKFVKVNQKKVQFDKMKRLENRRKHDPEAEIRYWYLYMCVYCVYVCACVCVCVCIDIYICICMHAYMYIFIYTYV